MKAIILASWHWLRRNYAPRTRIVELLPLSVENASSLLSSKLNYDFGLDFFHMSKGHIECVIGNDNSVRIIEVDNRGRSSTTIEANGILASTPTGSVLDLEYRVRKSGFILTFCYAWTLAAAATAFSTAWPDFAAGRLGKGVVTLASNLLFAAFGLMIRPFLRSVMRRLHRKVSRAIRVS